jgi:L-2,4-diaminobutyrate decarboxylase
MSVNTTAGDLDPARERIRTAYSPELFGELAGRWGGILGSHFEKVVGGDGPVLNWRTPPECIAAARSWLDRFPQAGKTGSAPGSEELSRRFGELVQAILDNGHNLHHPRYVGHQVPASIPIAALFDAVGSVTNQVMAIYEMGPWATAVERAIGQQ